jgi:hypothetical protein
MANRLYDKGRNKFARAEAAWKTGGDAFRAYLVDLDLYTPDYALDEFLSVIAAGALVANSTMTIIDPDAGVCDANDVVFTTVSGDPCEALVIVKWTGDAATSPLIAYIDTVTSGLPAIPNGLDITVTWDDGANKIFKL